MISIVVPLFNYSMFIKDNIESICCQTIQDWELIIVDDGSTDNPYDIIKLYESDKIKYIRLDENKGYGNAKNVGIRAANGEWVIVLDADDMLTKNSLEVRLLAMNKKQKKWCHAKAYEFGGVEPPYHFKNKARRSFLRFQNMRITGNYRNLWKSIHAQTVMIDMDVYRKVGLYEPSLRSMGDKEMWARIINNVGKPLFVDKFVAYYRQHGLQMHRSEAKRKNLHRYEGILKKCMRKFKKGNLSDALSLWEIT